MKNFEPILLAVVIMTILASFFGLLAASAVDVEGTVTDKHYTKSSSQEYCASSAGIFYCDTQEIKAVYELELAVKNSAGETKNVWVRVSRENYRATDKGYYFIDK